MRRLTLVGVGAGLGLGFLALAVSVLLPADCLFPLSLSFPLVSPRTIRKIRIRTTAPAMIVSGLRGPDGRGRGAAPGGGAGGPPPPARPPRPVRPPAVAARARRRPRSWFGIPRPVAVDPG